MSILPDVKYQTLPKSQELNSGSPNWVWTKSAQGGRGNAPFGRLFFFLSAITVKDIKQLKNKDNYYSVRDFAALMEIPLSTAHYWTRTGAIQTENIAGRVAVPASELIEFRERLAIHRMFRKAPVR